MDTLQMGTGCIAKKNLPKYVNLRVYMPFIGIFFIFPAFSRYGREFLILARISRSSFPVRGIAITNNICRLNVMHN